MTAALVLQLAILLHGHHLTLHVAKPAAVTSLPLVVYATGDAGWKRGDRHTFDELRSWGYPVVGFSSPDYLKHLGHGVKTITPEQLARDYNAIVDAASTELGMDGSAVVVLLGVSRGADLSIAAAAQKSLQQRIKGVVAIGLTAEEEYLDMYDLYGHLPEIGSLSVAIVQSTHDGYVPAARARQLFGDDDEHRQLRAVPARNHNFSDARAAMYEAIRASLAWIDGER
jgi:type IV secretory pathway VirJ component